MPKLEPEVEFSVATFAHELAKYLNFTVRRPGAVLPRIPLRPFHQLLLLERSTALPKPCSRHASFTICSCLLHIVAFCAIYAASTMTQTGVSGLMVVDGESFLDAIFASAGQG